MRLTFGRHINREPNGRFENRNPRYRTKVPKKRVDLFYWTGLVQDNTGYETHTHTHTHTHNKKEKAKTVLYSISDTIRLEQTALH